MQQTDIANPPEVRVAHTQAPDKQPQTTVGAVQRTFRLRAFMLVLLLLLLALPASLFAYRAAHDGRIYRGVKLLGTDLGGMSKAEARTALTRTGAGYPSNGITVHSGAHTWNFTPADLGLGIDADKTLEGAMSVGRAGSFMSDAGTQFSVFFSGTQVTPVLKHDTSLVDKAVARVAADTDRAVVDSKLEQGSDGKVVVTASSMGASLDRVALKGAIEQSLAALPFSPVDATVHELAPKITEAALRSSEAQALRLTEQPITLGSGKHTWMLEPEDLRGMLVLSPTSSGGWSASLDKTALASFLKPVADKVRIDPEDASVVIGKGTVNLNEDVSGKDLDMPAAVEALANAANGTDVAVRAVDLPMKETSATVTTAQVQALYDKANTLVTQGIRLHYKDDGYILRGTSVTGFIDVAKAQGGPGPLQLVIDEDVLAGRISGVAYNINRQATDARFRMVDGSPRKINAGNDGLKVNIAPSTDNAKKAIEAFGGKDRLQVDLDVAVTPPTIKDADTASINTPDLLATGQTSYAGSSAERAWNVGLGTRNVDGTLVPPGGVFSTVDTIGDLTLAAGFKMGYAIMHTPTGLTTVPAEAGGICQVSTTLFHSVFRAGIPIVERNWHSYWIGLYGRPPSGLQGLDATIAPPEKDFRFKNTTGNWLLIRATADGKNVTFELYGVNPHWNVSIAEPVITNRVKTSQDMITEKSSALAAGKEVVVEHAQDGFDSAITRVITDAGGNVVDKWTARSHYQPAHNRTLIGTGEAK